MSTGTGDGRSSHRIRLWSLCEDVLVEADPDSDQVVVVSRWGETRIADAADVVRESLRRMSFGPVSLENVLSANGSTGSAAEDRLEWPVLRRVLDLLCPSVVHSLGSRDGEELLLSAVPVHRDASFTDEDIDRQRPVRLSRFAALRAAEGTMRLESPLAGYQVLLHRALAAQVVATLSRPITLDDLATLLRAPADDVADIVAYLVAAGTVLVGEWASSRQNARFAEDTDPVLALWSHHDLQFHCHSRKGQSGNQSGAVFPHADKVPAPPLVKPIPPGRRVALHHPTQRRIASHDPPLSQSMENVRPVAEAAHREVDVEQLGELLFRAARIRAVASVATGTGVRYEISDRPYLSVNGLHELELYVVANNCPGIDRAAYHYDPADHTLTVVNEVSSELDALLDEARVAARTESWAAVLIAITVRVSRSSWMYNGIGYSLALTHVGALQQTLSLVATAMGVAGCVPAIDPGDLVDTTLRLDWPTEVSLGEFLLG